MAFPMTEEKSKSVFPKKKKELCSFVVVWLQKPKWYFGQSKKFVFLYDAASTNDNKTSS